MERDGIVERQSSLWVVSLVILIAALAGGSYAAVMYVPRVMNNNGGYSTTNSQQTITMAQAVQSFKNYLTSSRNLDLALHEVEEYQYNFYAAYYEKSTGRFAFQMLIWKPGASMTGGMMGSMMGGNGMMMANVMPEPGPNMLWNTKYGMMNGMMGGYNRGTSGEMTVSSEQAQTIAQQYLNSSLPGKTAGDADAYYGYYTMDVLLNGSTFGMVSVNGYTSQVWYHTWHGTYVQTVTLS